MPSKHRLRKIAKNFWDFVKVESCAPSWLTNIPAKDYDRIIGFCEETPETEAFVLADEALFLAHSGEWLRIDIADIIKIDGIKRDTFLETVIYITTQSEKTLEYRGKNAFGLWSCLKDLINDASKRIEFHLSSELSQALEKISRASGRQKNDIAKEWLSEKIRGESEGL